jgi:hypothetical protein
MLALPVNVYWTAGGLRPVDSWNEIPTLVYVAG